MKNDEPSFKIDALIDVLDKYQPNELARLEALSPHLALLISKKSALGGDESDIDSEAIGNPPHGYPPELADLARASSLTVTERTRHLCKYVGRRIRMARNVSLSSTLIAGLASAGVIPASLGSNSSAVLVSATVAFLASGTASVSRFVESSGTAHHRSLTDLMSALVALGVEAEKQLRELEIWHLIGTRQATMLKLVRAATDTAAKLRALDLELGEPQ